MWVSICTLVFFSMSSLNYPLALLELLHVNRPGSDWLTISWTWPQEHHTHCRRITGCCSFMCGGRGQQQQVSVFVSVFICFLSVCLSVCFGDLGGGEGIWYDDTFTSETLHIYVLDPWILDTELRMHCTVYCMHIDNCKCTYTSTAPIKNDVKLAISFPFAGNLLEI